MRAGTDRQSVPSTEIAVLDTIHCPRRAVKMSSKSRDEKLTGGSVIRNYTKEFRRDAVGIIEPEGLTAAEVSRRLGVNVNVLRVSERLVVAHWPRRPHDLFGAIQ